MSRKLDQRCVRPGYWIIEGWDVRRIGRRIGWLASFDMLAEFSRETLPQVRAEIRRQITAREEARDDGD